jgi:hypothetical protein
MDTTARFTLDADRARDWLTAAVDQNDSGMEPYSDDRDPNLPTCFGAGWHAAADDRDGGATAENLLDEAVIQGIISCPRGAYVELLTVFPAFREAGLRNAGYRFLLVLTAPVQLTAATDEAELSQLGDEYGPAGADDALAVLCQAVEAGNTLLGTVASYAAQVLR